MIEYTTQLAVTITVQCFISTFGLLCYILVLKPLYKFRKTLFSKPFYTVCFALAVLDILVLIDRICLLISDPLLPATSQFILRLRSFYERFLHYGIACIEVLIAMERAVAVFSPKLHLAISNKMVAICMIFFTVCIVATNICIFTSVCPYIWYTNTTIVFIDQSIPSAILHNKVVDLGLQPVLLCITLSIYLLTGLKVMRVSRKVHSQQNMLPSNSTLNNKKIKLEHALVLQGLIVTIPHTFIIIVYHISFYGNNLPSWVQAGLNFTFQMMQVVGSSLNPILHLVLNKDLRRKTIESWCDNVIFTNLSHMSSKSGTT